ncbi:EpsG family protein [Sinomicrobium oceani]|uniref:EpsG family protein n=1 Tax=Sinomicrobium oceani TaxID=1150368 RepID=A0A1K1R024_9FLAO|nr:EpsG family protein [Sinomicrobium oceani]SFW65284.1 EpsG family protein [Sinomicrobium oceani]
MEAYFFILTILLFLLVLKVKNVILITALLIFIATFRDVSVGVDTMNYFYNYKYQIKEGTFLSYLMKTEIGWMLLNLFVKKYFDNFNVLLFLSSSLTIIPLSYTFKKNAFNPVLAFVLYVLLFHYFFSFSIIRQAIAGAFFVLSVYFLEERKNIKFILSIAVGALFHYSVLVLLPLTLILKRINLSYKWYCLILIITYIFGFSGFFDTARTYLEYLPFDKYAHYVDHKIDVEFNRVTSYLFILPKTIFFVYTFYYVKKYKLNISDLQKKLFWLGMVVLNLFLSVPQISRFVWYLSVFEVFIIVGMMRSLPRSKKLEGGVFYIIYSIAYFVYYLLSNRFGVVPYVFSI